MTSSQKWPIFTQNPPFLAIISKIFIKTRHIIPFFSSVNHACYDGTNHFAWFWHQKFDFQRVLTTFEIGPNHILWRHVTSDNRNFFFRRNQNNSSGGAHLKRFCSWYFSKALNLLPARGVEILLFKILNYFCLTFGRLHFLSVCLFSQGFPLRGIFLSARPGYAYFPSGHICIPYINHEPDYVTYFT